MNQLQVEPPDDDMSPASYAEGLPTATYLAIRGKEECYRAQRYRRPLSLVIVGLNQPDSATKNRLRAWLQSQTRASDIVAYLGTATYALLLPESNEEAALGIIDRIKVALPNLKAVSGCYPADGANWEEFFNRTRAKIDTVVVEKKRQGFTS